MKFSIKRLKSQSRHFQEILLFPIFMGIGDALFSTSVIRFAKQKYPRSKIIVATFAHYAELLICSCSDIDELWTIPNRLFHYEEGVYSEMELAKIIKKERVNLIVYTYKDSDVFFHRNKRGKEFLHIFNNMKQYYHYPSLQEQGHDLAWNFELNLPKEALEFAGNLLRKFEVDTSTGIISIHTRSLRKTTDMNWDNAKYIALIDMILNYTDLTVIRIGSQHFDDSPPINRSRVIDAMHLEELSLIEAASLIYYSDFFIGPVSGPAVIAAILEVSMVVFRRNCRNFVKIPANKSKIVELQADSLDQISPKKLFAAFFDNMNIELKDKNQC